MFLCVSVVSKGEVSYITLFLCVCVMAKGRSGHKEIRIEHHRYESTVSISSVNPKENTEDANATCIL